MEPLDIKIEISEDALRSVFDECDRYDNDETGGRIIGTARQNEGQLRLEVQGVIEPGPKASRSSTSFFQDGDYQASVFRRIEQAHPEVEHLGNWHTHHVNGFPTLSSGDTQTYHRIVNHEKHNLDLFYALLVTKRRANRTDLRRYDVRHYVFFRGDDHHYEVKAANVALTNKLTVWPTRESASVENPVQGTEVRAQDQEMLSAIYPEFSPHLSKRSGMFYWRGPLTLIDGSVAKVMIPEMELSDQPDTICYRATAKAMSPISDDVLEKIYEQEFRSAIAAIHNFERRVNSEIFAQSKREK